MFDTLMQDVRYAARSLARRPLVTAVAVLSLALGVGVNTAIFSVFDRVLLERLPVPAPNEIVNLSSPGPRTGNTSTNDSGDAASVFNYPLFRDSSGFRRRSRQLAAIVRSSPTSPFAATRSAKKGCSCPAATFPPCACARRWAD
jgi:hypothetical protein